MLYHRWKPSEKDNYKLFIDEKLEIHTLWEIQNVTLQVYEKKNYWKNETFIDISLDNSYTYQIKI